MLFPFELLANSLLYPSVSCFFQLLLKFVTQILTAPTESTWPDLLPLLNNPAPQVVAIANDDGDLLPNEDHARPVGKPPNRSDGEDTGSVCVFAGSPSCTIAAL